MINKFFSIMALLLCIATAMQAEGVSIIEGVWNGKNVDKAFLYEVKNGALNEITAAKLNDKNEFVFALSHSAPGFYVVGQFAQREVLGFVFYMKPGDRLSVAIEGSSYVLTGNNTPENKEMERWHDLIKGLEQNAFYTSIATYVEFFPMLDEVVSKANGYAPEYPVDAVFAEKFSDYRRLNLMHIALRFLYMPHAAHPQDEDMTDYYTTISLESLSRDGAVLDYPYGMLLIRSARMYASMNASKKIPKENQNDFFSLYASLDRHLPLIGNEQLKGEIVLSSCPLIKTFEGLQDLENRYGKYLVTDDQKARFREELIAKASNERGQDAFDFKFKDVTGKEIALSDFKGKVVYVDVWATWCGPCLKEFPHLKEMEEAYKKKDVIFIGVSSDEVKDHEKWKKFLKDNSMTGIQLFAGEKRDDIMKPYKISSIPRFLLFGKDGKIISSTAPRPSSSEIRPLLDELLKK